MRQESPVKAEVLTPMSRRAARTMDEMREADGVGLAARVHVPWSPLSSLGKSGGQAGQRAPGRDFLVQLVRGLVPRRS